MFEIKESEPESNCRAIKSVSEIVFDLNALVNISQLSAHGQNSIREFAKIS